LILPKRLVGEFGVADLDDIAGLQLTLLRAQAVDQGAAGATGILEDRLRRRAAHNAVLPRHLGVAQARIGGLTAADLQRLILDDIEHVPLIGTGDDTEHPKHGRPRKTGLIWQTTRAEEALAKTRATNSNSPESERSKAVRQERLARDCHSEGEGAIIR